MCDENNKVDFNQKPHNKPRQNSHVNEPANLTPYINFREDPRQVFSIFHVIEFLSSNVGTVIKDYQATTSC